MVKLLDEKNRQLHEEMLEKLRETLSQEDIDLLYRYFEAMNNFYFLIPLRKMLRLINEQCGGRYSQEDFLDFVKIVGLEKHYFGILGMEELFEEEPPSEPLDRLLVHETLLDIDNYATFYFNKKGKPYYLPPQQELLCYEDETYAPKTPQYKAMSNFLRKYLFPGEDEDAIEEIMGCILFIVSCDDSSPEEAWDFMSNAADLPELSPLRLTEFSLLYIDLHNHTHSQLNNGYTPLALYEKTGDSELSRYFEIEDFENFPINILNPAQRRVNKIGRNDPCPCGSGKKYKKCCGK